MLTNQEAKKLPIIYNRPSLRFLIAIFGMTILLLNNAHAESQASAENQAENSGNTLSSNESTPAKKAAPASSVETVKRAQFTTAIVDREPTDDVVMLTNNSDKIYYFSELTNLKGHEVTHRWKYQGKLMAEIKFNVKSNRWRVYSSKNIKPDWTGDWTVELVDENGSALDVSKLEVVEAKTQ